MISPYSLRKTEPRTVRWMNTLRRSPSSFLRRTKSCSTNRSTARVTAGLDIFKASASPLTVCGGGVR